MSEYTAELCGETLKQLDRIEQIIKRLEERPSVLVEAIMAFSDDNHDWSNRPCPTCKTITAALKVPFGCYAFQQRTGERSKL